MTANKSARSPRTRDLSSDLSLQNAGARPRVARAEEGTIVWLGSAAERPVWLDRAAAIAGRPCLDAEDPRAFSLLLQTRAARLVVLAHEAEDEGRGRAPLAARIGGLRAETGWRLPVLVVSAASEDATESRRLAMEAEADDFTAGAPEVEEAAARLNLLVRLGSALAALAARPLTPEPLAPPARGGSRGLALLPAATGLADARQFESYVDSEWRRARRNGGSLSVILFETFSASEAAGEATRLPALGRVLRPVLRRGGDLLACLGPRRFAALLPDVDADGAKVVLADMRDAIQAADVGGGLRFGLATSRPQAASPADPQAFLRQAEEQLDAGAD